MKDNIFAKIRQNGLRWLFSRLNLEMTNPTLPFSKAVIDTFLRSRKTISRLWTKQHEDTLLYAMYDLDVSAITYNLVEFLVDAEYEAHKNNKKGFVVVFVPASNDPSVSWKEYDSVIDTASKKWRFENILVPLTSLSPKCYGTYILSRRSDAIALVKGRDVYPHLYDGVNLRSTDIVAFFRKLDRPHLFEGLRASTQGLRYIQTWLLENRVQAPVITITIRNHAFDKARNSNIEAWSHFARHLQSSGYHAVVVPDTDTSFSEEPLFAGVSTFRECAWNIGLRMALYESAYLNFFVPNGCATLAFFNPRCSYICMNSLPEGSIVTTKESYARIGHPIGTNYKFATSKQRLSFKPDSYENILDEFKRFLEENDVSHTSSDAAIIWNAGPTE